MGEGGNPVNERIHCDPELSKGPKPKMGKAVSRYRGHTQKRQRTISNPDSSNAQMEAFETSARRQISTPSQTNCVGRGLRLRELVAQSRSLGSSPRPTSFVRWNQIATPTRSNLRLLVASCAALATSPNASSLRFEGSQTWMPRSVVSQFGMVLLRQEGQSAVLELLEKLAEGDYLHGLGQVWELRLALGRFY